MHSSWTNFRFVSVQLQMHTLSRSISNPQVAFAVHQKHLANLDKTVTATLKMKSYVYQSEIKGMWPVCKRKHKQQLLLVLNRTPIYHDRKISGPGGKVGAKLKGQLLIQRRIFQAEPRASLTLRIGSCSSVKSQS